MKISLGHASTRGSVVFQRQKGIGWTSKWARIQCARTRVYNRGMSSCFERRRSYTSLRLSGPRALNHIFIPSQSIRNGRGNIRSRRKCRKVVSKMRLDKGKRAASASRSGDVKSRVYTTLLEFIVEVLQLHLTGTLGLTL